MLLADRIFKACTSPGRLTPLETTKQTRQQALEQLGGLILLCKWDHLLFVPGKLSSDFSYAFHLNSKDEIEVLGGFLGLK